MRPSAASRHSNSAWITERTSKEDKLHLLEHKSTIRKLYRHNCHLASHDHQEQWKKMRTEFFKRNYDWQQHSQGQWWWILHAGLLPQDQAFLTSRHSPVPSGNAAHHQLTEFMENIVTWHWFPSEKEQHKQWKSHAQQQEQNSNKHSLRTNSSTTYNHPWEPHTATGYDRLQPKTCPHQ